MTVTTTLLKLHAILIKREFDNSINLKFLNNVKLIKIFVTILTHQKL